MTPMGEMPNLPGDVMSPHSCHGSVVNNALFAPQKFYIGHKYLKNNQNFQRRFVPRTRTDNFGMTGWLSPEQLDGILRIRWGTFRAEYAIGL